MLAGQLQDARERLLISFAELSDEEMAQPGVAEKWSVRDVLAHVAAWDRAVTAGFREMLDNKRPELIDLDEEAMDEFNLRNHRTTLQQTLDEVIAELNASRQEMIEFLREIDNARLFAPAPGDEHADLSIAGQVRVQAAHDEEHAEMIEEWRDNRPV
jgi:uncharacterized damage-inducible protein DinB